MVWIPAGTFQMGNTSGTEDRWTESAKEHTVTISEGFWLAKYETTQEVWKAIRGGNPSLIEADNHPVTDICWMEAMAFIKDIQGFDSKFDLPTEAQWEHAAKAGTNKDYSLPLDEIGWHRMNTERTTHSVGEKKPNPWGLYDIHGNVSEWVQDWHTPFTSAAATDPTGPDSGERKIMKGGQYTGRVVHTRSFDRQSGPPEQGYFFTGFRIMRRK